MAHLGRNALHLGAGALLGAYAQDPRKTWGAKGMSPDEKKRRVRKVRLGGALKGLSYVGGYKAIGRAPNAKYIAPIVGAVDGAATYVTDDEHYLRRVLSRRKNESQDDYARRLTASRRNRALARGLATGTIYAGIQDVASEAKKLKDTQERFREEYARFEEKLRDKFNQAFGGGAYDNAASAKHAYPPTSVDEFKQSVLTPLADKLRADGLDVTDMLRASNKAELEAALKKAYRKASLKAHPDRGGSGEAMARLNALNDELVAGMSKLAFYRTLYARAR
jgi:hypothetical protein